MGSKVTKGKPKSKQKYNPKIGIITFVCVFIFYMCATLIMNVTGGYIILHMIEVQLIAGVIAGLIMGFLLYRVSGMD